VPDARERRWLLDACREADLVHDLMIHLEGAPRVVRGSQGQDVAHPLSSEIRQHRVVLGALLARVSVVDPRERSSGTGSRTTTQMARAAALARHGSLRWGRWCQHGVSYAAHRCVPRSRRQNDVA